MYFAENIEHKSYTSCTCRRENRQGLSVKISWGSNSILFAVIKLSKSIFKFLPFCQWWLELFNVFKIYQCEGKKWKQIRTHRRLHDHIGCIPTDKINQKTTREEKQKDHRETEWTETILLNQFCYEQGRLEACWSLRHMLSEIEPVQLKE